MKHVASITYPQAKIIFYNAQMLRLAAIGIMGYTHSMRDAIESSRELLHGYDVQAVVIPREPLPPVQDATPAEFAHTMHYLHFIFKICPSLN